MTVDAGETLPEIPSTTRWRASELTRGDLTIDVELDELAKDAAELIAAGRTPLDVRADELPLRRAGAGVDALRDTLAHGRGIAVVPGFPIGAMDPRTVELVFWRIGLALGTPVSQSVMGDRLGHVVDHSDTEPDGRAYRRNEELTPHSDPADYLAFLCLRPAAEGGESHFVSSLEIHEEMRRHHPELLGRLHRGYRYSRFGEQSDDEFAITPYRVPVFSERDGQVSCRLVRLYIEIAATEDPACGLDDLDRQALDVMEALATDPRLALSFTLAGGEAVFANNYTVLHARSAFRDPPGAPKRHLLRLWIDGEPGRPVQPEMRIYPLSAGIPPQPGRLPTYATEVEIL